MILAHFTDYAAFKTAANALLGAVGTTAAVHLLVRDGTPVNTGCTMVCYHEAQQVALRCTQMAKPPTLTTDFPKLVYVADLMVT